MSSYLKKIRKAMHEISKINNTIFLGQSVRYSGNSIYASLEDVPLKKRIELPVMEEAQMGMSVGLALQNFIPIS